MAKIIGHNIEEVAALPCDLSSTAVLEALKALGDSPTLTLVVASKAWQGGAEELAQRWALGLREDSELPYQDTWYVENADGRRVGSWAP